ncbi:unnamed protein product [Paramecium octaurelia]|uniref:Protein kinase domain-containing protein n=1 Tax=Paramecium octaurelia TaxID=43137 RepID=A0A8S1XVM8_PAROT|nr:unnamed protein product [Paramecium octaurelia]
MKPQFCQLYPIKIQEGPYIVYDKQVGDASGIFLAYNYDVKQDCCAKIIDIENDEERQNQIKNHEQMSTIFHENIIRVYKVLQEGTKIYVIQELCNMDFQCYLNSKSYELKNKEILDFIQQVSNGYLALENKGIIHRDLKPKNILVNLDLSKNKMIYKICDFGLVKIKQICRVQTYDQQGTECYKAPEIRDSNYSYEADAFSFGIVLLEIIIKKSLNQGLRKELIGAIENNGFQQWFNVQKLKNQNPGYGLSLDQTYQFLVKKLNELLAYDPKNRISWQSLKQEIDGKINYLVELPLVKFDGKFNQNLQSHQSQQSFSLVVNFKPQQEPQQSNTQRFARTVGQQNTNDNNQVIGTQQNQFQPIIPVQKSQPSFQNINIQQIPGSSQAQKFFNCKKDQ